MPRRWWIAALSVWPGLPQIWTGQDVTGLILAALFAATTNLALVSRFLWTDAFSPGLADGFGILALGCWLGSFGYTLGWVWLCHPCGHRAEIDRLFREATEFYLQGRFQESRQRFEQIMTMDENDADALMQLGTLYMRTEQPILARRAFRRCLDLEGGAKWRWEVQQALARLAGQT